MTLRSDRVERLDVFLARLLPEFSRTRLAELISRGEVAVDGRPQRSGFKLAEGMSVEVRSLPNVSPAHDLTPADIPVEVVYEDEQLLVVSKPRGLATHPAPSLKEPSLVNALLARGQELSNSGESYRPGIVHRLDKETTGLIVVAKTDAAHLALARQFERKTAKRTYLAVVAGTLHQEALTIDAPIGRDPKNRQRMTIEAGGRKAVTHVRRLADLPEGTLIEAELETGRTHQIRVHLAWIKHPVLGDNLYAPKSLQGGPLQLHAYRLRLVHPSTGKEMDLSAPPPEDFVGRYAVPNALNSGT